MSLNNNSSEITPKIINFDEVVSNKQTKEEIKSVQEDLLQYEGDEFVNWKDAVETVLGEKLPEMDLIYKKKYNTLDDILDMLPNGNINIEDIENGNNNNQNIDETLNNTTLNNIIDLVNYKKTHTYHQTNINLPLCEQIALWSNPKELSDIEVSLLLADIRRGFEAGELQYQYQAQWDLKSGKIVSLESCLHWNHPTKGKLGADYLISVFEKSGLLPDLTVLLFEQMIKEIKPWHEIGLNIPITFGVVPEQMETEGLSGDLLTVIYNNNLSASDFECVFYNTKPSQKPQTIHQNIRELQTDGFGLCLNNFGTGYSAYPYIQSFVFDKIKFDKSYLTNILTQPRVQLIVQSFIQQAHLFGSHVIADGINGKQIYHTLQLWNCDYGQGFYLQSPMSSKEMIDFLKEYAKIKDNGIKTIEDFRHNYNDVLHTKRFNVERLKKEDK